MSEDKTEDQDKEQSTETDQEADRMPMWDAKKCKYKYPKSGSWKQDKINNQKKMEKIRANITTTNLTKRNNQRQLEQTVILASLFTGMNRREIAKTFGMTGVKVRRRLAEVINLDPIVEARERMEAYLPLAITRAIEACESGDTKMLGQLLQGSGIFRNYHSVRDENRKATEQELREHATAILVNQLRNRAITVRPIRPSNALPATEATIEAPPTGSTLDQAAPLAEMVPAPPATDFFSGEAEIEVVVDDEDGNTRGARGHSKELEVSVDTEDGDA